MNQCSMFKGVEPDSAYQSSQFLWIDLGLVMRRKLKSIASEERVGMTIGHSRPISKDVDP